MRLRGFLAVYLCLCLQSAAGATTAHSQVFINEIESGEFIELYDGGAGNTKLDGMSVVLFNGSSDLSYGSYDLSGFTTDAEGYFILADENFSDADITIDGLYSGPAAATIFNRPASHFPDGSIITTTGLVDAIVYDNGTHFDDALHVLLNRNQHQVNTLGAGASNHSLQRIPNGEGGLRNTWTYVPREPTPRAENTRSVVEVCASGCDHATIQGAVTAVAYGDIIIVHSGTYHENVDTGGKALTLRSRDGAKVTTINGGGVDRVLKMDSPKGYFHTTIDGLTITNGAAPDNGAGDRDGGGIYSYANWLTITDSVISNNRTSGMFSMGGGIGADRSHLVITDTAVNDNVSEDGGGGILGWNTSLDMSGGKVSGNSLTDDNANGGGISIEDGDLRLAGVIVSNNTIGEFSDGGGVYFSGYGHVMEIRGCTITGNSSEGAGGGIYATSGDINGIIADCTISGNSARSGGGVGLYDGYQQDSSHFNITDCTISDNSLVTGYYPNTGDGGGVEVSYTSASINDSVISGNGPAFSGGGIECSGGYSALTLTNSIVSGNLVAPVGAEAWDGGGVDVGAFCDAVITNSAITGNRNNGTSFGGGGIYFSGNSLELTNSTVSDNEALQGGGGIGCGGSSPDVNVLNSIFSGNTSNGLSDEIDNCSLTASYSNIEGGDPGNPGLPWPGVGNIDDDPLFRDARPSSESPTKAGDYRLTRFSPSVDVGTGDKATYPMLPSDDLEGHPRPLRNGYDMGAYEYYNVLALKDSVSTPEITPVTIKVLDNDKDSDGDPLAVTNVAAPQNGTVSTDGTTVVYAPAFGFVGTETFSYSTSDGSETSAADVEVTVAAATDPIPVLFANGSATDITLARGEKLSLDAMLRAGKAQKTPVDWWLVVRTPFPAPNDWYHFTLDAGWSPGLEVTLQGPCTHVNKYRVLDMKLPPGKYSFYFGVDSAMNGKPDMKQMSYTKLDVTVQN